MGVSGAAPGRDPLIFDTEAQSAAGPTQAQIKAALDAGVDPLLLIPPPSNAIGGTEKARAQRASRSKGAKAAKAQKGGKISRPSAIQKGTTSGVTKAGEVVIRDEVAFSKVWSEMGLRGSQTQSFVKTPKGTMTQGSTASPIPAPAIDFEKTTVIAVFAGTKPTSGHTVDIPGTRERDDGGLDVMVRRSSPAPNQAVAPTQTQPFCMVSVPRVPDDAPVTFVDAQSQQAAERKVARAE